MDSAVDLKFSVSIHLPDPLAHHPPGTVSVSRHTGDYNCDYE